MAFFENNRERVRSDLLKLLHDEDELSTPCSKNSMCDVDDSESDSDDSDVDDILQETSNVFKSLKKDAENTPRQNLKIDDKILEDFKLEQDEEDFIKGLIDQDLEDDEEALKTFVDEKPYKIEIFSSFEPDDEYVIPFGKARVVKEANPKYLESGETCAVITYGRGVYWTLEAEKQFEGQVEIIDLRTLNPVDFDTINEVTKKHGKVIVVTEESVEASFSLGLAGRIQRDNFKYLDAPVQIVGSVDTPAIPLNSTLEAAILTNATKVKESIEFMLGY